jgi:hypothetical protein
MMVVSVISLWHSAAFMDSINLNSLLTWLLIA